MTIAEVYDLLHQVTDPEIPVLSIIDLGVVRNVEYTNDLATITITPTYTGCPAMDMISANIKMVLFENGITKVNVVTTLWPAWTTEWMTDEGKEKLNNYGIAPPKRLTDKSSIIECPHCHSSNTKVISEFGSTACKALYKCNNCLEPFDYFKCY